MVNTGLHLISVYIVSFKPLPAQVRKTPKRLPRYGLQKNGNPWVGTTGAGQNCPERESESLGEDGCMVSSFRCFFVQLFLRSIYCISDALGHAEHVMNLFTCKPCTVCLSPDHQKKSTYLFSCAVTQSISASDFSQACTVPVNRSMQAASPRPV